MFERGAEKGRRGMGLVVPDGMDIGQRQAQIMRDAFADVEFPLPDPKSLEEDHPHPVMR